MKALQANGLNIWLNDVELSNRTYVSLAIGGGFASEWMGKGEERIRIGSASSKLYADCVKRLLKESGFPDVEVLASVHCTSLVWQTTGDACASEVQQVLDLLFQGVPDRDFFEAEKWESMKRFKNCYKDLAFRGHFRMMEFAHQNTLYRYESLVRDLQGADFDQMCTYRDHVIHPANMFLFVHGKVEQGALQELKLPELEKGYAEQLFNTREVRFADDEVYEETSKGNWQCGCIRFERKASLEDLTKEYAVLALLGEIQFNGHAQVNVDLADASITYKKGLKKYKYEIMESLTEESFEEAKKRLLNNFETQVRFKTMNFVTWAGQCYMQHIHVYEWLEQLNGMDYERFKDWIEKSNYQVREGYLAYRKEAAAVGK